MKYNIYCDESCHLENDHQNIMVLGGIKCNKNYRKTLFSDIRKIKQSNNINSFCEVKWNKVSPSRIEFYKELLNYFFDNENLSFRAVIIDKSRLKHELFNQTHDDFYYKVYYQLLCRIIVPGNENYIYLDIKDTKGAKKIRKLKSYLANGIYDFNMQYVKNVQTINSKESELLQLADIIIGAISYINRKQNEKEKFSEAKMELIDLIIKKSGYSLQKSTILTEEKLNLFFMNLQ